MNRHIIGALLALTLTPVAAQEAATEPKTGGLVAKAEGAVQAVEAKVSKLLDFHVRHQIPQPTKVVIDGTVACQMVETELHCTARAPEAAK